uniref:Uncharacterized protein n=1 Tax=Lygus hesperus TaxID=30085 RepID=A0A0A9X1R5_LYGHE
MRNRLSLLPDTVFQYSIVVVTGLSVLAKQRQIIHNYTHKSTGVLSVITSGLQLLGSCARVFTTVNDVDDMFLVLASILSCLLNAIIVFQIFYYSYVYTATEDAAL